MDADCPASELIPDAVQPNSDTTSLAINCELGRPALGRNPQTTIDSAPRYPSVAVKLADNVALRRQYRPARISRPVARPEGEDRLSLKNPTALTPVRRPGWA